MRIAIRYQSRTGNTKRLALVIERELNTVSMNIESPLKNNVDVLFLGFAMYSAKLTPEIKTFIEELDPEKVRYVALFSTSALLNPNKKARKLLEKKNIKIIDEFHCVGEFMRFNAGRPNRDDQVEVRDFAKEVIKKIKNEDSNK